MRVVIADDAPLIREGVARLLTENGVEVVDELLARRRLLDPIGELTSREREILALMAEGRSNQGISRTLWLSPKTVETHIRGAFAKLGIREAPEDNRRVLAVLAYLRR